MIDRFSELLYELGKIFGLALLPDKSNACTIAIAPLSIQLELNQSQETLLLFTKIIALPPGKFRENVLIEALKANALPDPRPGIFGYFAMTNHLTLHQSFPLHILNGERLAGLFGSFFEWGESWHTSIQRGEKSPLILSPKIPFGMKP
jgi:hypothetical protein